VTAYPNGGPLTLLRKLRSFHEISRVALKQWSEVSGELLAWIEFTSAFRALQDESFPDRQPAARDGRVSGHLLQTLRDLLRPIPITAVGLRSWDESDYDDYSRVGLRCPPGCFLSVQFKPHHPRSTRPPSQDPQAIRSANRRGAAKERANEAIVRGAQSGATLSDDLAARRGRLYCRARDDDDPEWPTWEPRDDTRRILAVAATAWASGKGSLRKVAAALNAEGLHAPGSAAAFAGTSLKDLLIAVELVEGSG
jgi:hypothetical protein